MRFSLAHLLAVFGVLGTSSAEAITYYVRNGGSDSADGKSHATAWASLSKVNGYAFAAGDRVLFHEGDRWVGQLTVDWPGTSSVPAVVGAYYVNGSTAVLGYRTARPIIDGEDQLPSTQYAPLVAVRADRVRVENLRVVNSEGRGISVADVSDAEIIGCTVSNIYDGGIHILNSRGARAENNVVTRADVGFHEDGRNWNASIAIVSSTSTVVRNNTISEVWGEGINANDGSQYTLIENNRLFAVRSAGIYADAAPDTTIRRNIVVGTANSQWWRGSFGSVGPGIVLNNEKYHYAVGGGSLPVSVQTQRAKIYGNLIAYTNEGIAFWHTLAETSFDGTLIYNNTFVDNNTQVSMSSSPKPGSKFLNNILLSLSGGTRDINGTNLAGMVARNNYFSQGDPGGGYVHAGNRFTGLAIAKMSGWRAVTNVDQISWRDFAVTAGSSVLGAGDDEPLRASTSAQNYQLDYIKGEHRQPMDMGGLTFGTPVHVRPLAPTSLAGN
jgi:parallel beta-helix repeat protein